MQIIVPPCPQGTPAKFQLKRMQPVKLDSFCSSPSSRVRRRKIERTSKLSVTFWRIDKPMRTSEALCMGNTLAKFQADRPWNQKVESFHNNDDQGQQFWKKFTSPCQLSFTLMMTWLSSQTWCQSYGKGYNRLQWSNRVRTCTWDFVHHHYTKEFGAFHWLLEYFADFLLFTPCFRH